MQAHDERGAHETECSSHIPPTQIQKTRLTVLLHLLQELDHDLTGRADEDLTLSTLLSVGDSLEAIGEDRYANHFYKLFLK